MSFENASVRKFTQLVTNHVLGNIYGQKVLSVVHGEVEPDEFQLSHVGDIADADPFSNGPMFRSVARVFNRAGKSFEVDDISSEDDTFYEIIVNPDIFNDFCYFGCIMWDI